jgi:hypothetical protein
MKSLTNKESAAQAAQTSRGPAAPTSPPSGGSTSAAKRPQPRRASIFYYLFALAALFLDLFLFHMVERVTYGVSAYWGFVPGGLAILFRFRYCLFMVPLVLFAIGRLSSRTAWPRTPVAMACAAIATLLIFFYAALMLATPVIANLPIDYDVDKSVPLRISEEDPAAPTSPPQGGQTSLRSNPTSRGTAAPNLGGFAAPTSAATAAPTSPR